MVAPKDVPLLRVVDDLAEERLLFLLKDERETTSERRRVTEKEEAPETQQKHSLTFINC